MDLPTEAQSGNIACRAGHRSRREQRIEKNSGQGEDLSDEAMAAIAWYEANSRRRTHDVGEKAPNAWGLYDMCGNVSQWCLDWLADYSGDATNSVGPTIDKRGGGHVLRGGYWSMYAAGCRSAARNCDASAPQDVSNTRYSVCGFRIVLTAE